MDKFGSGSSSPGLGFRSHWRTCGLQPTGRWRSCLGVHARAYQQSLGNRNLPSGVQVSPAWKTGHRGSQDTTMSMSPGVCRVCLVGATAVWYQSKPRTAYFVVHLEQGAIGCPCTFCTTAGPCGKSKKEQHSATTAGREAPFFLQCPLYWCGKGELITGASLFWQSRCWRVNLELRGNKLMAGMIAQTKLLPAAHSFAFSYQTLLTT